MLYQSENVTAGTPAFFSGIKNGDVIIAINAIPIDNEIQAFVIIQSNIGKNITLDIHRGTKNLILHTQLKSENNDNTGILGVKLGKN